MTAPKSPAYVRTEMLPQASPPPSQQGLMKWLRENLFSSWVNAALTLASLFLIYAVLSHILPWMVRGIWDAGSLTECRTIRDNLYGDGVSAACWAVLGERWHQLLFGFYPQELYWRPIMALIVFLTAVTPVLFNTLPRSILWFTALSPFIIFFLLWGGTLWGPIVVLFGFVIGWAILTYGSDSMGTLIATIAAIVAPILYWIFAAGALATSLNTLVPIGLVSVASDNFGGFMLSFVVGISGIILSLPLGIALALGRQSNMFIINASTVFFIEVIRGVPLIVWLFTAYLLLNYFLPPGTEFDLMLRVVIMVTLFSSAYIAEVIRGGLAALPRGQYEGADSLGLTYGQSMRLIILPQALKISIPGIVSTFIGLFKDTTLLLFIGLFDPLNVASAVRASIEWNGVYWELFIFIGLCFFVCCYSMSQYSQYLERKLSTDHH